MPDRSIHPDSEPSRAEINRQNAQHSTGPTTPEGKAKSSLNAIKSGLTGRTVLLPSDDADAYRHHLQSHREAFLPVGSRESALVQTIADNSWRIERIPLLEMNIYALGHLEFAPEFETHEPDQRPGLVQIRTFLAYEKQLRNLHIQENRLRRQRQQDIAELQILQQTRLTTECRAAADLYLASKAAGKPFHPAEHGFEFSIAEIEIFLHQRQAAETARTSPDFNSELAQGAAELLRRLSHRRNL